jgi:hypothetical protein
MSSTEHTITPNSNLQLIIDALAEYADQTGTDLSQNPFAEKIQHLNTPDTVLELLKEREKAFKEYRDANRGLIDRLSPAIRVLHAFSGTLGEALSLVCPTCLVRSYVSALISSSHSTRSPSHQQRPSLSGLMSSSLYVPSTQISIRYPLTHNYSRRPVVSVQAMTPFSNFSNLWAVSSNGSRFIPAFHPPQ